MHLVQITELYSYVYIYIYIYNNNNNLRVQWDLTGFYHIVFDVRHVMQ